MHPKEEGFTWLSSDGTRASQELIHPDQACTVPGRKITDSLLLIRDTICLARDRNFRLVVLNLDFEKAFDRVSHQYLFQEREPVSPVHGLAFGEPSTVWCNVNHTTSDKQTPGYVMDGGS
ncbi:hypothetical protein JOQ06_021597 [Pogonophryne albipinna]|uniref:Reverse transcriptase domain-containing protein n=1 Tax=Pogonophryne albipinna TaxID=1090488 RepID=A0AAD6F6T1_9TELE|nr:hypothetical protein JOQ06_021597 [Pogonophryne albipinna]